MSTTLLTPRPALAVHQVVIAKDGTRSIFVRLATRTDGLIHKRLYAGENHQPLLPFLASAAAQLPHSYAYSLAWGTGAGSNPSTYVLRFDHRDQGVRNDYLIGPDHRTLWGRDGGADFIDFRGQTVSRSDVDLVGIYPTMPFTNEEVAAA